MRIAGYIGFGVFSLLVSLYLTRPDEVIGERLVYEVRKQSKGQVELQFESFELDGLAGMEMEKVTAVFGYEDKARLEFDSVRGGVSVLSMLMLSPEVEARLGSGEGFVEVEFIPGKESNGLNLSFDSFDLGGVSRGEGMMGLPVAAIFDGSVESTWVGGVHTLTGTTDLELNHVTVGPGTIKGVEVPRISLGDLTIGLRGENGRISIVSFNQKGGDVKTSLSGDIGLRSRLGGSSLNLCVKLKVNEEFLEKNSKVRSVLELASIQLKKDGDDFLHVPMAGRFERPRLSGGLCRSKDSPKKRSAR